MFTVKKLDVSKFDFHAEWNRSKQVIVKYISRSNIDIWKVSVIIVVDYLMNMDNDDRIARSAMNCLFSVRTFFLWKSEYVTIEKKISMEWRTAAENWLLHHHRQHWFLLSSSYELSGNRKKERKNKMTHTHTHMYARRPSLYVYKSRFYFNEWIIIVIVWITLTDETLIIIHIDQTFHSTIEISLSIWL